MSDLFAFDLADGLASGQCPLCHALDVHLRRWLESFWREGRRDPGARERFYAAGGFCRRHAWALHELAGVEGVGVAVADVYGRLAERDLATLDGLLRARRGPRKRAGARLQRRRDCSACVEEAEALPRKAQFLLELLSDAPGRSRYEAGHAVCFAHLVAALEVAGGDDDAGRYLLDDWRRRLEELRGRLHEYDRKRDHRYVAERREEDERAWIDIVEHYTGSLPRSLDLEQRTTRSE